MQQSNDFSSKIIITDKIQTCIVIVISKLQYTKIKHVQRIARVKGFLEKVRQIKQILINVYIGPYIQELKPPHVDTLVEQPHVTFADIRIGSPFHDDSIHVHHQNNQVIMSLTEVTFSQITNCSLANKTPSNGYLVEEVPHVVSTTLG